jgi:hypothetical protein
MPLDRTRTTLALGALILSALALGGCASSIAELPIVGTSAGTPSRPNEPGGYLPVEDLPPDRDQAAIPLDEQTKIKKELLAARDRQAKAQDQSPSQNSSQSQNKGQAKNGQAKNPSASQGQNQTQSQNQN